MEQARQRGKDITVVTPAADVAHTAAAATASPAATSAGRGARKRPYTPLHDLDEGMRLLQHERDRDITFGGIVLVLRDICVVHARAQDRLPLSL